MRLFFFHYYIRTVVLPWRFLLYAPFANNELSCHWPKLLFGFSSPSSVFCNCSSSCESDLSFEITFRLIPWEVVGSVSHAAQCVYLCVITHKRTCSSGRTQAFYLTFLSVRKYEHKYKAFSCQSVVAVDNKKMDSKDVTRFFFSFF